MWNEKKSYNKDLVIICSIFKFIKTKNVLTKKKKVMDETLS